MVKTQKKLIKKSVTKKNQKNIGCPIGLKPFEEEFGKKLTPKQLRLSSSKSKQEFVKAEYEYQNVEIVNSEFPQRGELLPYYYFHKNRYFNNAVIIHDSVFFHKRIAFEKLERMGIKVIPMWHFDVAKEENIPNSIRLSSTLKNNAKIMQNLNDKQTRYDLLGMSGNTNLWNGCFGVQSFINYNFLDFLHFHLKS